MIWFYIFMVKAINWDKFSSFVCSRSPRSSNWNSSPRTWPNTYFNLAWRQYQMLSTATTRVMTITKMRLPHIYTGHPTPVRVSIPGSLECPCSTQRRPSLTGAFLHIEPRIPLPVTDARQSPEFPTDIRSYPILKSINIFQTTDRSASFSSVVLLWKISDSGSEALRKTS